MSPARLALLYILAAALVALWVLGGLDPFRPM